MKVYNRKKILMCMIGIRNEIIIIIIIIIIKERIC